jgi:hypothetical protein
MSHIAPIDQWQLDRLNILAGMIEGVLNVYREIAPQASEEDCAKLGTQLNEFRVFYSAPQSKVENATDSITQWMEKLEDLETDLIRSMFSKIGNGAIEILHQACRTEGEKWGLKARKTKGDISHDARKALLVLNDYLIDGMPSEDNIEIKSSEAGQVTYITHHCNYQQRFGNSQVLAWGVCSSRQAWKDGFFGALGGVAHQNVCGKCLGDDVCMNIITLAER